MVKSITYDSGIRHVYEELPPEQRPQDRERDGSSLKFELVEHHGFDVCPEVILVRDAGGRTAKYIVADEYTDAWTRPQNHPCDRNLLRIETIEHGKDFPDDMPLALRVTDPEGRCSIYRAVTEGGKAVNSMRFELGPRSHMHGAAKIQSRGAQ
ncbi:MAG: hypothetical protein QOJ04_6141 [Caballeronia sp.]|jgi:hypothetical protein|nr:hypothetical protein [Caballeronia sp.]